MNETDAKFVIPPAVATRADFSRVMLELERVDNDLEAQKARAAGQPVSYLLPAMSRALNEFVEVNKIDLASDKARMALRERMRHLKDHAPVVQMTFARDVDPASMTRLAAWCRENLHPQTLLQVGMQPALVGGVYIRTPNHVYDFSLRQRLQDRRSTIAASLDELLSKQAVRPTPEEQAQGAAQ